MTNADVTPPDALPPSGRLAGVDYGHVRLGLAISDARQTIASPFENYQRQDLERDRAFFTRFCEEEQVVGFVVGLPVHMSGEESEKSREVRRFGVWLREQLGRPVCFFDERLSSAAADRILSSGKLTAKKRKQRRDMLAAQIILAGFLESSRIEEPPGPLDG